jgi:hypothetical protein
VPTTFSSPFLTIGIEVQDNSRVEPLDEITEAILKLATKDDVDILELAAEGRLKEIFPYKIRASRAPELEAWDDVVEAPNRPLTDEEYQQFLRRRPIQG